MRVDCRVLVVFCFIIWILVGVLFMKIHQAVRNTHVYFSVGMLYNKKLKIENRKKEKVRGERVDREDKE